ncbi:MAG: acyl-CoA dehydrogenase family protein [Pseudomonadota bacterium]|nr:acyl-CoA dehydrogenase family protein [Pseudomonadota bacterium]
MAYDGDNRGGASGFSLTTDQQEILDTADRYAREQIYPLAQRMDDEEWWPDAEFRALGPAGYLGVTAPVQYGGAELDVFGSGLVLQAFSRWNPAFGLAWVAHDNLCMNNILRNGNEDIRSRYVPGLANGSLIGALGLTEPGAGSDALGSMRTVARRDGDDYVLNGRKLYITNGPIADVLLVYAKTEPERGTKGISAFVVEKDFPGFSVAQKLIKMGFRGSQTGELVFDDCRVPARNMVGELNRGHVVVMSGLDLERAMISPICLGISERALELTVDYARERQQFGKPIASFQMVQSHIADMYTMVEAIRLFTYRGLAAVNDLEEGQGGRGDVHKISAASVMFAANTMNRVLDLAVQVHGGIGYIWESEINRLYRHTKLLEIGAGTTEVRKMIIAEEVLK